MNLLGLHLSQSQQTPNPSYRQLLFTEHVTGRGGVSDYWKTLAVVFLTLHKVLSLVRRTISYFPSQQILPQTISILLSQILSVSSQGTGQVKLCIYL